MATDKQQQPDNIWVALSKAQAVLEGAKKDAVNPHLRNRYADLASCWDACRKALTENGLSVTQTTAIRDGSLVLITTLHYTSGESISGELPVIYENSKGLNPMQAMGSALTYSRRYGLCAIVGISPEDDDGAGAGHGTQAKPARQPERAEPPRQMIDDDRIQHILDLIADANADLPKLLQYFGVSDLAQFTLHEYGKAVQMLQKKANHETKR